MDFEHRNVLNVYSKINKKFSGTRRNKWDWITIFLETFEKESLICDLGCGNGRNMNYDLDLRFTGVDNCPEFLEICTQQGLNVVNSDMTSLPFPDNYFNGYILIAAFHHLSNLDRRSKCLKEIYRTLKPNGRCLISIWSKNQPDKSKRTFDNYGDNLVPFNDNGKKLDRYYYIFRLEEITDLFRQENFKIIDHNWDYGNEIFILEKR